MIAKLLIAIGVFTLIIWFAVMLPHYWPIIYPYLWQEPLPKPLLWAWSMFCASFVSFFALIIFG